MSSPVGAGPSGAKDGSRRLDLGKYVKKFGSIFRRGKSSKKSVSSIPAPPIRHAEPEEVVDNEDGRNVATIEQVAHPETTIEQDPTTAPITTQTDPIPTPSLPPSTQPLDRTTMQQQRAHLLFTKYSLNLESHELISLPVPAPYIQRVEKPIRMRIHRSCHQCGTSYGSLKTCPQCTHKRCKKCPRYPNKKNPPPLQPSSDTSAETTTEIDLPPRRRRKLLLSTTTPAGNERAYNPPQQRIRRTCHKCSALFVPHTATICPQCAHTRCTKCPRDPAKRTKWPAAYPGDVEPESESDSANDSGDGGNISGAEEIPDRAQRLWRKPRMRVRWSCSQCATLFSSEQMVCGGCGHERCGECVRWPPKTVKTERRFDDGVVGAVEERLRGLSVRGGAGT
ncbi:hypothetical protein P153DRAFT_23862 [Dothidotthia symphoricarpi CBS 119687]|uniref:Uncharacterized protein n=1 Tax=Dothidotthia symphoricarpi CBS 119687 TaxID=1392245 RepID=A0A6A6AEE8_9PLEO|nr:uncharacterized protein P153DRAFT_23862 [Dothidotthia symphoricarpi CBS 119687]KAF2129673.1 hypothetical protein P153DRAFT_23862 [Dothidotthia symphoricarpi CBS 119687]